MAWLAIDIAEPARLAEVFGVHAAVQALADLGDAVDGLIAQRAVRTFLQPLVRMSDRRVIGYEALSRGPQGSPLEQPDMLFNAAALGGKTVEMELLCARLALERTADRLPAGCLLTLKLGPEALAVALDELPLRGRCNVWLELTEHLPLDQAESLASNTTRLRAQGIGLVLDDTGCGFADMNAVRLLRPEIVKLCITVIRNVDRGPPSDTDISAIVLRLRQLGHHVLAEGVETEAQDAALLSLGVELAQGWLYGRPRPVDAVLAS
ncbi:MAG: EAL domain-containing protein [Burkholderiales bacterium]|nr:EAL domain-containing protein [Burkholderiales bacterium]